MVRRKDQERALHAYTRVSAVLPEQWKDYKVGVNSLGANIIRSGLAATVAWLERESMRDAYQTLRNDLASGFVVVGGDGKAMKLTGATLPDAVRNLPLGDYMLATRELLALTVWLKRAVQARESSDESKKAKSTP